MPQMAPMNWMMIFLLTLMLIFFMICLNYFSFYFTPQKKIIHKSTKINWKW
uniref:ATP synthase complex subunit 8 n=1 Tax=Downesia tarsata TaxID=2790390 RepID=A0A7T1FV57_9CUCU|nr:ATP synthase F0 subunit 8 [Downesia tarsata]QPM99428.1 ATP synthase F0 subunit 8 [Downesia tarsata]